MKDHSFVVISFIHCQPGAKCCEGEEWKGRDNEFSEAFFPQIN